MFTRYSARTSKCPLAMSMCGRPTSASRRCHGWPITRFRARRSSRRPVSPRWRWPQAGQAFGASVEVRVTALEIERPLILDAQTRVTTQLSQSPEVNRVEIQARSAGGSWSRYAVADIEVTNAPAGKPEGEGAEIVLPDEIADHPEYRIHPVLLDAALRQLAAAIPAESDDAPYQAVSFETIRVFGPIRGRARSHTELVEQGQDGHRGRIVLTDDAGATVAELTGIELKPVDLASVPLSLEQKIFDAAWVQNSAPQGDAVADGTWLVLAESDSETTELAAEVTTRLSSPTRRVISAALADESAVAEAFANTGDDPDFPPVGIVVLLAKRPFDSADADGALRRAQDLIVEISAAAHAAVEMLQAEVASCPSATVASRCSSTRTAASGCSPTATTSRLASS